MRTCIVAATRVSKSPECVEHAHYRERQRHTDNARYAIGQRACAPNDGTIMQTPARRTGRRIRNSRLWGFGGGPNGTPPRRQNPRDQVTSTKRSRVGRIRGLRSEREALGDLGWRVRAPLHLFRRADEELHVVLLQAHLVARHLTLKDERDPGAARLVAGAYLEDPIVATGNGFAALQ
jgi:hypothetical protein